MKNIFAEVLSDVLAEHDKELGSLFSMTSFRDVMNPNKVSLLKKSLTKGADNSAVLSAWELDIVREYFRTTPRAPGQPPEPISAEQDRQLKAAIFAEGIRRLVLDRLKSEAKHEGEPLSQEARASAYHIGRLVYELLLGIEDPAWMQQVNTMFDTLRGDLALEENQPDDMQDTLRGGLALEENQPDDMQDTLRGGLDLEEDRLRDASSPVAAYSRALPRTSEAPADPLATGVEIFMQGALWLEVARGFADRAQQQMWAASALALLTRAQTLLNDAPSPDEQQSWLDEIGRAIQDAHALL